jgi:condensin complex subunit 2
MDPDERELVIGMGGDEGEQKVFAYFDTALAKNWAGPEHWKMRRTIRKAEKERQLEENEAAAAEGGKGKKREKKQPEWLDFSAAVDSKKLFASGKASITLPAKAKRGAAAAGSKDEHLLPDDKHFSSQQLLRLFLKPKAAVNMRRRLARAAPRPEGEVDEHYWAAAAAANGNGAQGLGDMDAADDDDDDGPALPFDTQFFHDEADTPDFDEDLPMGGDEFEGPVRGLASTSANAGSNAREEEEDLLAATQGQMRRARPLYVNYAKKAKRVDVRMLKENIWKELAIEKQAQAADDDEVGRPPSTRWLSADVSCSPSNWKPPTLPLSYPD